MTSGGIGAAVLIFAVPWFGQESPMDAGDAGAPGVLTLTFIVLVTGGFMTFGVVSVVRGARAVWLSRVLGIQTLTVPGGEPLLLGGLHVARFERRRGSRQAPDLPELSAELICEERVRYLRGTETHTVTEQIYRRELSTSVDGRPDSLSGEVVVEVPANLPPTMSLGHNEIVWSVKVRVTASGVPDDVGTFPIEVRPALAPRVLDGGLWGSLR